MAAVDVFTSATNGQSNTSIGCSISVVQLHKLVDTAYDDHNLLPQPRKHKRKTLSTFIHPVLTWSTDYTSQLRSLRGTTALFTWTWPLLQNDWWYVVIILSRARVWPIRLRDHVRLAGPFPSDRMRLTFPWGTSRSLRCKNLSRLDCISSL